MFQKFRHLSQCTEISELLKHTVQQSSFQFLLNIVWFFLNVQSTILFCPALQKTADWKFKFFICFWVSVEWEASRWQDVEEIEKEINMPCRECIVVLAAAIHSYQYSLINFSELHEFFCQNLGLIETIAFSPPQTQPKLKYFCIF